MSGTDENVENNTSTSDVDKAIAFLVDQGLRPNTKKSRTDVQLNLALQTIEQISHLQGIAPNQISKLLDVAVSSKLGDNISAKLIKCLIPHSCVPGIAAVKAISWICTNTLSIKTEVLLIKWLVIVYDFLEEHKSLQSLYGIIFLFLEKDSLCPHASQLLYNLTTAVHVKQFRIKKLMDLQARVGPQPHLLGLLSMYKVFCPNLISVKSVNKVWFKPVERSWRETVRRVQAKNNPNPGIEVKIIRGCLDGTHDHFPKKRKLGASAIPDVQTTSSSAMELKPMNYSGKVTLEQISTFKDLLQNIDNIELPNQIAAVLKSSYLQHVVSCNVDLVTLQRLNFWLNHSLHEEFISSSSKHSNVNTNELLLEGLIRFSSFLQECVPASDVFIARYLFTWNGLDYRPLLLKLITLLNLQPFERLNELVLEPLRDLFFSSSIYVKCQIMYCLTELLRNFAVVEIPRQRDALENDLTKEERSFSTSLFLDDEALTDYFKAVFHYIQFVDRVCAVGLQVEEDHTLLQNSVLSFYELVSRVHRDFQFPFVFIPSPAVVYRLLFACNPVAISRLCSIIVNYKSEFENLKKSSQNNTLDFPDGCEGIQLLNQYILDICDSLWRNKAFVEREKSCFSVSRSLTDSLGVHHINEAFSIHNHVALSSIAWKFLHDTQPEEMKLAPSLIKGRRVRQVYLEFMVQRNLDGILTFLNTFIRKRY